MRMCDDTANDLVWEPQDNSTNNVKTPTLEGQDDGSSTLDFEQGHGHFFTKKNFHRPAYCHSCSELIWGLIGQGFVCEVCNFVVHDRCVKSVVSPCSSVSASLILNPVSHCWNEPAHYKRKFCNVCRKRMEDVPALKCEICEYYTHLECQDFVTTDCKDCATFFPDATQVEQLHHWREGNLPGNSKCSVCKRTCWTSECLSGYRCGWCGTTAHASCYKSLTCQCFYGVLHDIMLPPAAVSLPRTELTLDKLFGLQRRNTSRTISEDWSSSGNESKEESVQDALASTSTSAKKSPKEARNPQESDDFIKIYDGNAAARKKQYRLLPVSKSSTVPQLIEQCMKVYHVLDDPKLYTFVEFSEKDGLERRLDESTPIKNQFKFETRRPSVILRFKEHPAQNQRMSVKVYPTGLQYYAKMASKYRFIPVTKDTTAQETLVYCLKKFGCEQLDPAKFDLVEVCLDKVVSERTLPREEKPLALMLSIRRDSIRQFKLTRFYIQPVSEPSFTSVALYVGNLKCGLSQRVYEKILLEKMGTENRWDSVDVIYYEYGSLVLIYLNPEKAQRAFNLLKEAWFDDKNLLVLLLPQIHPHLVPDRVHPLLVLVNVKSGGCQGLELVTSFRKLLNPHQVFNLDNGGPLPGLYVFRNLPYYKILVCGGDGTVGWALSCLDNVGQDAKCTYPPMAIVPLGTGNDLARVLRWGSGYGGQEDALTLLREVAEAEEVRLDRWTVIFYPQEAEKDETKMALQYASNAANTNEDNTSILVMNNYFGIGIDADLSLDFHLAREENPAKFNSRFHNKGVYFKMGVRKMLNRTSCKDLHRQIEVEVDGRRLDLPPLEGIIILNILSWASGANPWGSERDEHFSRPNHWDGQLEVVGVTGVVHMGQIFSGLRGGTRLAQGGHIKIQLKQDIPVQVDGEPWVQPAGQVVVLRSALKATMLKKSKGKMKRRNTEPSLCLPEGPSQCPPSPPPDSEGAVGGSEAS